MYALTIALRAVHFTAVIALFGVFAFHFLVARTALRGAGEPARGERLALRRRSFQIAAWSLVAALGSGVGWLVLEAASMSGMPLGRVLDAQILGEVLGATQFGRVWEIRSGLLVALGAALMASRHIADDRSSAIPDACGTLLAGALLATLAWAGHAAAERAGDRIIHLSVDAVHLLAAGAWLGGLPALAFVLGRAARSADTDMIGIAARAARSFSLIGVFSVAALVLTGVANAWYTVGSVPALIGTSYGRSLLVKLLLFAAMVSLAAVNRLSLTPAISDPSGGAGGGSAVRAGRKLRRNAIAETVLGLGVVAIIGALGVTVPALHLQPLWPFSFTLDWNLEEAPGHLFAAVTIALAVAVPALALALYGAATRACAAAAAGAFGLVAALAICARLLAVEAYPTTYFRTPARYTADSLARGMRVYAEHCAVCHGSYGLGDGPAAGSLSVKPANLTDHVFHHREGDILWWLQHGIAGTPMPGVGDRVGEDRLWDLINFIRAQAEIEQRKSMNDMVEPWRAVVAPDFTFQIGSRGQESLVQLRGRNVVLLIFYDVPESLARLRALTEAKGALGRTGVRVIALPMTAAASLEASGIDTSILADPDARVAAAYSIFRRAAAVERAPSLPGHIEFLIDRNGYLRARWTLSSGGGWGPMAELLRQIEILRQEELRPQTPVGHLH